ncbi:MAG: hydrogenase expression/formation protein [Pseudomonadota bacterium]|nr:hydrogenase expression/formation protein [Pseudomonadota bacterium]
MSGLNDIPINVEETSEGLRGNALPILHEIRHGLSRLAETGETTLIDLHAIPFGPGDEDLLLSLLGRGEVEASISALGPTRVWETQFPGVWLVDHCNANDERIALHIEIAGIPDILRSQPQDIAEAVARLDARLAAGLDKTGHLQG